MVKRLRRAQPVSVANHVKARRAIRTRSEFILIYVLRIFGYYMLAYRAPVYSPTVHRHSLHLLVEGWPRWVDLDGYHSLELAYPPADGDLSQ